MNEIQMNIEKERTKYEHKDIEKNWKNEYLKLNRRTDRPEQKKRT